MADTLKSYALTTVDRVASFMGISPNSSEELILLQLINQVTEFIEKEVGFRIKKTAYTNELADGDESGVITVKNRPIDSGSSISVQYRTSQLNQDSWEIVDDDNYTVDHQAGQILGMGNYKFRGGRGLFRVSYTAGYDFDNVNTFLSQTEAGDLEYAAWKLVAAAYSKRRGGEDVQSESIGDYSVTYKTKAVEDDQIRSILDNWSGLGDLGSGLTPINY